MLRKCPSAHSATLVTEKTRPLFDTLEARLFITVVPSRTTSRGVTATGSYPGIGRNRWIESSLTTATRP